MGLTFDTGALIVLERRDVRMRKVRDTALAGRVLITVPMASVAQRGDVVYTSDVGDLVRLRDVRFPGVRVLAA